MKARTARAVAFDDLGPPQAAFLSARRELRGWGCAAVVELPAPWVDHVGRVGDALAEIEVDEARSEPGLGPVAMGALPFDRDAAARFIVPSVVRGLTPDGAQWSTVVDGESFTPLPRGESPGRVEVVVERDPDDWCRAVADATKRIADGQLVKVVLARRLLVRADRSFDAAAIAERLFDAHPHALRFLVDGVVGASPELLVSRIGDVVRAHPMAGTTPRTGDATVDSRRAAELLASAKNREEHQITIDAVHDALLPWCSYLDAEPEPSVVAAGSVQHLASLVEGRLSHPAPSVLELVAALHPTPAVGGWPRAEALRTIRDLEGTGRGRYAGPVGWVDAQGNGAFAVGIRSVELNGDSASVLAGVGVVADSDPLAELEETRAKLRATLPALLDL